MVSFSSSIIEDIFELRVPRLQITRGSGDKNIRESLGSTGMQIDNDNTEDKKELRREIKRWWEGIADHLDKLVSNTRLDMMLEDIDIGFILGASACLR